MFECIWKHKKRYDFRKLLIQNGMSIKDYIEMLDTHNKALAEHAAESIAKNAAQMIYEFDFTLPAPKIRTRTDITTGKIREIGCECAMQQILDIIAVNGAMDVFKRRMVIQQASSVPGRGQVYGMRMIQGWVRKDNAAMEYAKRHGFRHISDMRYFVKTDIQKCYPSMRLEAFMRLFRKDCGNVHLLWLWETLLRSHRIDARHQGFMIGALTSQWAAQYCISFAFQKMMHMKAVGRRGREQKYVSHMCIFMDDMLLTGGNRRRLKSAVERLCTFMQSEFGLTIKPNWEIMEFRDNQGIDMMGYVIYRSGKTAIRARDFIRARRMALRAIQRNNISYRQAKRITAYKGYFKHTDCVKAIALYQLPRVWGRAQRVVSMYESRLRNGKSTVQRRTGTD